MADADYPILWQHDDPAGFTVAIPRAMSRIWDRTGNYTIGKEKEIFASPSTDDITDLRALVVGSVWLAASVSTRPPDETTMKDANGAQMVSMYEPGPADFDDDDRRAVARALMSTWRTMEDLAQIYGYAPLGKVPTKFYTTDASPPVTVAPPKTLTTPPVEGWPVVAAVVVGTLAFAGMITYDCYHSSDSLRAVQNGESLRMLGTHTHLMSVYYQHLIDEKTAGKKLPLSDTEKAVMAALLDSQKKASDSALAQTKAVTSTTIGAGLKEVGSELATVAAVLGGLYLLTK